MLSGSYIVSGTCKARVEHVGKYNYASKISCGAKYVKKINSQIMSAFNRIILILSILIIPIGFSLFTHQLSHNSLEGAVVSTTAALIGMIPEGLMLLVSTVLAVSVLRLSKHKVLVQELYCIETLARVDTLCLDKTGTITQGTMRVHDIVPYSSKNSSTDKATMLRALSIIVNNTADTNPTYCAIKEFIDKNQVEYKKASEVVSFSPEKKWSGAYVDGLGSFVMGAAEFVFGENFRLFKKELQQHAKENRVLVLAHSKNNFVNKDLPQNLDLMGFILIKDVIRETAADTLKYFYDQGVDVKIISGDSSTTVANIAKRVGVKNYEKCIDAKAELKTAEDIQAAVKECSIFGRVSPMQKKEIIGALKEQGHTVAMVGDGVNDVLALKESDCSVVMANGSDAARNVAQLVLLNSDFSSMPKVVLEGRRSINNIQRSASLFLVKTIYSTLLFNTLYPFMPIQMTLTSVFTIGIPSFVLALEANKSRINGNLFVNIISKALPCALTIVSSILTIMAVSKVIYLSYAEISTLCVILTGFSGLSLLFNLCLPFNFVRKFLFYAMSTAFLVCLLFFRSFFSLASPNIKLVTVAVLLCFFASFLFKMFSKIIFKTKKQAPIN